MENFDPDAAEAILRANPTVTLEKGQSFEQIVNPRNIKNLTAVRAKIKALFPGKKSLRKVLENRKSKYCDRKMGTASFASNQCKMR